MILSGLKILEQIGQKRITISPFNAKRVNSTSVDVTLGDKVSVYQDTVEDYSYPRGQQGSEDGVGIYPVDTESSFFLDSKKELAVKTWTIPETGWVLKPGICYLMHTVERIKTDHFAPALDGKSSIGRLFIQVHETASFAGPGFDGQFTLEVTARFPIKVYVGMRIAQVRFHKIDGSIEGYKGAYQGEAAEGPVPSKAFKSAFD